MDDQVEIEDEFEIPLEEVDEEESIIVVTPDIGFDGNLVNILDADHIADIGAERLEIFQILRNSRQDWEREIENGIRLLGLLGDSESEEGTCNATHPLLLENIVKFEAKAIQELWPAKGPVRTKIKGYVDDQRLAVAQRVRQHMNYQLTEQVPGFYAQLERNLFRVGFLGTGIRKAGWNGELGVLDPSIVNVENFYVDPVVSHLQFAEEYIETMELGMRKMQNLVGAGVFANFEDDSEDSLQTNDITEAINRAQGFSELTARQGYAVGEAHCYLDLHGNDPEVPLGAKAPYIVHFNTQSGKVYSIRRNWFSGDPTRTKRLWYTVDTLIPAFGFYGFGFLHLIGGLSAAATAAMRSLVDAGEIANMPSGFKSKDAKIASSDEPIRFGEWRDVEMSPEELSKAFFPLPAKEPSQTLYTLLNFMVTAGQKFADTTDQVVAESSNYGPVATTLALLEASQRFYSAIHKRLHQSQHEFLKLLGQLNFENLPDTVRFVAGGANAFVQRTDYNPDIVDVLPASDPNALSESQRVAKAQIELETAARFPQLHDMREAVRRFYVAMGTEDLDKLMPASDAQAFSGDPLSELQMVMKGRPIAAKMGQNHMAHIAVKEAFMQAPQMQGTNDPSVAVGLELLKANIAEHKTLMFIAQIMMAAQQAGLPPQDEQVQAQIAQALLAQSAEQGLGGQPSTEQQMVMLNAKELELAKERIDSQNVRESAQIAQKNRELDLKQIELLASLEQAQQKQQLDAAKTMLDSASKMAQSEQSKLAQEAGS